MLSRVLYGYETWSLTLKEENMPRVYKNRMLKKILRPLMEEVRGGGEDCIKSSFKVCALHR
jgi:hypothetical protein